MIYKPDWEAISNSIERLMGAGYSSDEARMSLVRAIADRKIRIRFEIGEVDPPDLTLFTLNEIKLGDDIVVPIRLDIDDFDWSTFCPIDWWASAHSKILKFRFKWLEVRREDVTSILLPGAPKRTPGLARATHDEIRAALISVYGAVAAQGGDAPNLNQVVGPVRELLEAGGRWATKEQIQDIASEKEFSQLRRPPGVRLRRGAAKKR